MTFLLIKVLCKNKLVLPTFEKLAQLIHSGSKCKTTRDMCFLQRDVVFKALSGIVESHCINRFKYFNEQNKKIKLTRLTI